MGETISLICDFVNWDYIHFCCSARIVVENSWITLVDELQYFLF